SKMVFSKSFLKAISNSLNSESASILFLRVSNATLKSLADWVTRPLFFFNVSTITDFSHIHFVPGVATIFSLHLHFSCLLLSYQLVFALNMQLLSLETDFLLLGPF